MEVRLVNVLFGSWWAVIGGEQPLEDAAHDLYDRKVLDRRYMLPLLLRNHRKGRRNILLEQLLENRLSLLVAHRLHPRLHVRAPAYVRLVEEDASGTEAVAGEAFEGGLSRAASLRREDSEDI